jgi:O-succinylbenzoic acid--CoA ligase
MRNGLDYVALVHGIGRLGATLVPINVRLTPSEVAWQLEDCGAVLVVHDGPSEPLLVDSAVARVSAASLTGAARQPFAASPIDLDRLHSIIYTSGTTGRPKGALLTWGNFWWSAIGSVLNLGLTEQDRWLATLPLFHVGGLSILLRSVIYGMPVVVHESFDPVAANRAIDDDGVSIVSVVAVMLQRMLEERGDRPYPPSFRCMLLGGGPAPEPLLRACGARGVPVVQTYGLTESASQVATLAPADALRKLGSAGRPLLPTELRIEDAAGNEVAPGEPGEIVVRGPTISPGYLSQPNAREATSGWLRTGDLGLVDDEGFLYVLDRRDDLIVSGGENVYPAEIEAILLGHPGVAEAAVVGEPHADWGAVPVAVVVVKDAILSAEALLTHLEQRLARYKLPRRVIFQSEPLPRNAAGKLQRAKVREALRPNVP